MKYAVAGLLVLSLVSTIVCGQTTNQRAKSGTSKIGTPKSNPVRSQTLKICKGVPIPQGYIIVAYENSSACQHGAYVLKKDDESAPNTTNPASRPRKVGNASGNLVTVNPPEEISTSYAGPPELQGPLSRTLFDKPANASSPTSLDDVEEVSEGDVVRINTNLVHVPVSVLDRHWK